MKYDFKSLTKYLQAAEDQGYCITFSFSGYEVDYEGEVIAKEGRLNMRPARDKLEKEMYNLVLDKVIEAIEEHGGELNNKPDLVGSN